MSALTMLSKEIAEVERELRKLEGELAGLYADRDSWGADPKPRGIFDQLLRPDVCRSDHAHLQEGDRCPGNHTFLIDRRTAFERNWRDVPIDTGKAEIERRQYVRAQIAAHELNCEGARRHLAMLLRELHLEVA